MLFHFVVMTRLAYVAPSSVRALRRRVRAGQRPQAAVRITRLLLLFKQKLPQSGRGLRPPPPALLAGEGAKLLNM